MDLSLPRMLARTRLLVSPANGVGCHGTVGAIRLLRVARANMSAGDRLLLLLDLRQDRATLEDEAHDAGGVLAARHLRVLELLNRELRAGLDPADFVYRATWDDDARRLETHLVAQRPVRVALAGLGALALRRGESIRTSVSARFDRARLASMLAGVGLRLDDWSTDEATRVALASASPA